MMQTNMETVPYLTKTFMVETLYLLQSTVIYEMLDITSGTGVMIMYNNVAFGEKQYSRTKA